MTYDRRPSDDTRGMRPATLIRISAALAALGLFAAACSEGGGAPSSPQGRARQLYERNCAACHGPSGEGRQLGTLSVPSLREGRAVTDPDARVLTQMRDGGNGMPPFKATFDDRQIQDLVRFIRVEIQGKK